MPQAGGRLSPPAFPRACPAALLRPASGAAQGLPWRRPVYLKRYRFLTPGALDMALSGPAAGPCPAHLPAALRPEGE
ncbi:hypothetical protein MTBUT4_120094 [Magnetospirillum sp. UT-4]|nr:hypothetical protein MTBUT4_120094 [Magnetospirillum sp. UT-4]